VQAEVAKKEQNKDRENPGFKIFSYFQWRVIISCQVGLWETHY
jgi:hypothetical protein